MDIEKLLEILACPECKTPVELVQSNWLVCESCHRKYPIVNEIPVMLVEEGTKHMSLSTDELPDPSSIQE